MSFEIAFGIFIPDERVEELEQLMDTDPAVAQAMFDIQTALTDVAPGIQVQRCDLADWLYRMETDTLFVVAMDCLMDRMTADGLCDTPITLSLTLEAKSILRRCRQHSVANFALSFGTSH